jgi:hypothetical protein
MFFAQSALLTEAQRLTLTTKDRLNFYDKATTCPLLDKLSCKDELSAITDPTKLNGGDFFTKSLDFNLSVKTLREHIERHVMDSAFTILNVEERLNNFTGNRRLVLRDNNTISLLVDYASIDLNTVLLSTEYYVMHSNNKLDAENLAWSQELIMNCCDDEMKHYLQSRLSLLPDHHHGGPTVFMMLVERIISNDEHLSRALITRLNNFTLSMVPGENIEEAAAFIKTICSRLDTCGKLPPDVDRIVFEIMMTGSVERFQFHLQTLDSMQDVKMKTYESILREAVRYYTVLHTGINQWLPLTKQPSMFMGNGNSNGNGGNAGLPRGVPSHKAKPTHDAKGNPIDRTPPATGDAIIRDSKTMAGKREYWCDTCVRWGSHDANHHDAWKQRNKEFFANKKRNTGAGPTGNSNLAGAESGNHTPTPMGTKETAPPVTGHSNLSMLKRLVKFE